MLLGVQVGQQTESVLLILLVIRGPHDRGTRKDLYCIQKRVLQNEIVHIKRCGNGEGRDMGKLTLVLRDERVAIPR